MPGRTAERSRYAAPAGGITSAPRLYGFSTGLTSIASPNAWTDQYAGPFGTALRQLKPDVLSAAIEAGSLPPYASSGCMCRIGNRCRYRLSKTFNTSGTTDVLTTIVPVCGWPSKPQ